MKKFVLATLISISSLAAAEETLKDFYFGPEVGASVSTKAGADYYNKKIGTSGSFGVFAGYKACPNTALELNLSNKNRFSYKHTSVNSYGMSTTENQRFSVISLTANGLFYIDNLKIDTVIPFVSAGVGVASVKSQSLSSVTTLPGFTAEDAVRTSGAAHRSTNFIYNIGAGVEFPINDTDVRLSYRFSNFGKAKTNILTKQLQVGKLATQTVTTVRKTKIQAHEFLLAVKFKI